MGLFAWALLGLIAGWLAKFVVKDGSKERGCTGLVVTMVIGIVGAAIGGWIGTQLGWGTVNDFDIRSIGLAFIGAVIVLLVLRAIRSGR